MRPQKVQFLQIQRWTLHGTHSTHVEESTSTLLVKARTTDRNKKETIRVGAVRDVSASVMALHSKVLWFEFRKIFHYHSVSSATLDVSFCVKNDTNRIKKNSHRKARTRCSCVGSKTIGISDKTIRKVWGGCQQGQPPKGGGTKFDHYQYNIIIWRLWEHKMDFITIDIIVIQHKFPPPL